MELDFLGGVGKVGLEQGIRQQPSYPLEDELEVLRGQSRGPSNPALSSYSPTDVSSFSHNLVNLQSPEDLGLALTASTLESSASGPLSSKSEDPLCKAAAPGNPQMDL